MDVAGTNGVYAALLDRALREEQAGVATAAPTDNRSQPQPPQTVLRKMQDRPSEYAGLAAQLGLQTPWSEQRRERLDLPSTHVLGILLSQGLPQLVDEANTASHAAALWYASALAASPGADTGVAPLKMWASVLGPVASACRTAHGNLLALGRHLQEAFEDASAAAPPTDDQVHVHLRILKSFIWPALGSVQPGETLRLTFRSWVSTHCDEAIAAGLSAYLSQAPRQHLVPLAAQLPLETVSNLFGMLHRYAPEGGGRFAENITHLCRYCETGSSGSGEGRAASQADLLLNALDLLCF